MHRDEVTFGGVLKAPRGQRAQGTGPISPVVGKQSVSVCNSNSKAHYITQYVSSKGAICKKNNFLSLVPNPSNNGVFQLVRN